MADLALLWHMHQPDYRDPVTGHFTRPWVLLHALKDYADMANHLERHEGVHCTVNFVPVLLDQLDDYAQQMGERRWRDPLLRILDTPPDQPLDPADRRWLQDVAFHGHAPTMLEPFAPFRQLRDLLQQARTRSDPEVSYLSDGYFSDLATWCLLAWSGESLRRAGGIVSALMAKGSGFELAERRQLLAEAASVIRHLVPRYRALQERGQIELSASPSHHPLAPLLIDFHAAQEALPDCPLPAAPHYPGGLSRVAEQIASAQRSHAARFGLPPRGLWPAEGALSCEVLRQIAAAGFQWTASGQAVLAHSAGKRARTTQPWQAPEGASDNLTLFFRNDHLSDLIGFEYAKWQGSDAAQHFMGELAALHREDERSLIPVFLDGENAWEYYPYNAWYFFQSLYQALEHSREIQTVTMAQACQRHGDRRARLPRLVAGSWVYGTFSTWIGQRAKNTAWEMLCNLKQSVDRALNSGRLSEDARAQLQIQLAVCESSDWFWWMGEDSPADAVAYFDQLYRDRLRAVYQLLTLSSPAELAHPIGPGGSLPGGSGAMRRAHGGPAP